MIKKLLLLLLVFSTQFAFSQVGINTVNPNSLTVLDVTLALDGGNVIPKGVMVPRMTEAQRNQIDTSDADLANSLLVYNTDEDCFNYFSKTENIWVSLCGDSGEGNAIFTIDCNKASVKGNYMVNTNLVTSNYIALTIVVTKAGSYNLSAFPLTDNGYYFSAIGEFVKTGTYTLRLPGVGTPIEANEAGDKLILQNNNELLCDNLLVKINPAKYTLDCNSIVISGDYIATIPLTSANTIQIKVTADATLNGYAYETSTPIVNGYSFSASGTLVTGDQIITLTGSGTPIKNGTDAFELRNNSTVEGIQSCEAKVTVAERPVRILTVSSASIAYNIGNSTNYANRAIMNPDYFSLNGGATYSNSGFVFSSITSNGRLEAAMTSFNPDIIIAQYAFSPTTSEITTLTNFVNKGGVFIYATDYSTSSNTVPLIQSIFGNSSITKGAQDNDTNNAVVTLENSGTTITNGLFKDLTGKGMARDAGGNFGLVVSSLPTSDVTIIAYNTLGDARMLAHKTKGFIFIGDGGPFGSSTSVSSPFSSPAKFAIDSAGKVTAIEDPSTPTSYNSFLFLNTIAWAIDYLKNNGGVYP